jgi:hypothetical protein
MADPAIFRDGRTWLFSVGQPEIFWRGPEDAGEGVPAMFIDQANLNLWVHASGRSW